LRRDGANCLNLEVRRVNGAGTELLASFSGYTGQRRPTTVTDAAGQTRTLSYNAAGQAVTVTNALNETITLGYTGNGYLETVTGAASGSTMTLTYDGYGRVRTVTEPDGYAVTLDYDHLNRLTKVTYPDGTFEEAVYDRLGVDQVRDRLGRLTRYTYDGAQRLTSVIDAERRIVQLDWCACGSLDALIDAKGQRTRWDRDVEGRVTREVRADGVTDTIYTYDVNGRLHTVTDPLEQVTTYGYALDGLVTQVSYSNTVHPTSPIGFSYDPVHRRLTGLTDGTGSTTITYRPVGQSGALAVQSVDGPLTGDTVSYGYDALGRVNARLLNGAGWTIGYDLLGRPSTVTHALGSFVWTYAGHSDRVASLTYPGSLSSTYTYLGNLQDRRLQTIHHRNSGGATLSKFDYTYDLVGNLQTWRQERAGQAPFQYTFTHDRVDQLKSAIKRSTDPTPVVLNRQAWRYDPAGNRATAQHGDNVVASGFDSLNRLMTRQPGGPLAFEGTVNEAATVTIDGKSASVDTTNTFRGTGETTAGTTTVTITARDAAGNTATQDYKVDVTGGSSVYTYDLNGNMTSDGVKTYQWNARNELIKVQQGGVDLATFTYDGFGRRTTKTAAGVTSTYIYDGEDIVEERRSTGDVIRYMHGPGIDQVLARTTNGANPVYYLTDHLGSVVQEVDATQAVVLNREYDPWGVPVQGAATSGYAFTGREWDAEIGLYYYRARFYQPETGSFLSDDPVFQPGSQQAYVWGRPLTHVDPSGRLGFLALLAPLVGPAIAVAGEALVYAAATLAGLAIAEAITNTIESRSQKEAEDEAIREEKFAKDHEAKTKLSPKEKERLRDRSKDFPAEARPEDALSDLEATMLGFRKGGRDQVDSTGKSGQKKTSCP
jgi:RHS repeat-associated protein